LSAREYSLLTLAYINVVGNLDISVGDRLQESRFSRSVLTKETVSILLAWVMGERLGKAYR